MDSTLPLKIGRYEVKSELGRGGMAVVFRALDPQVKREVAVKILPAQYLGDPEFRSRFEREAQTVATLEHPSIVPLYDFGEDPNSHQLYFVMRLMSGGSLSERIRRGPMTMAEVSRIIAAIAPGLDEAHSKGIVHRDLKPGNILFDQRGDPYITDFGIAKQLGVSGTLTGSVMGTPAYMSPEQARGERDIRGSSDIYSLGAIIFEMLTGQTPYHADTPIAVALKHITESVPDIRAVRPDLPADCQTFLDRAMAKDPDARFESAAALSAALNSILRGESLTMMKLRNEQHATLMVDGPTTEKLRETPKRPRAEPKPERKVVREKENQGGGLPIGWLIGGGIGLVLIFTVVAVVIGATILPSMLNATATPDTAALALGTNIAATHVAQTAQVVSGNQADATGTQVALVEAQGTVNAQLTVAALANSTQAAQLNQTATAIAMAQSTNDANAVATANAQATTDAVGAATAAVEATHQAALGAKRIAFFKSNDIWAVNVDGSGLTQLTTDGGAKTSLRWINSQTIGFISGHCLESVDYLTKVVSGLGCFNSSTLLEGFEVSPDGRYFAVSVDRITYVGDFEPEKMAPITNYTQLRALASCLIYSRSATQYLRWSADMSRLAIMVIGVSDAGQAADTIQLMKFECGNNTPISYDQFPGTRFTLPKFSELRKFQDFGWDGRDLFGLVDYVRNDGFGNMYVYNTSTKRAPTQLDPLHGCCYRDPAWSPDGQNFVFVWQDRTLGSVNKIELYYVPYNSVVSGGKLTPIPLPDGFFTSPTEKPYPVISP